MSSDKITKDKICKPGVTIDSFIVNSKKISIDFANRKKECENGHVGEQVLIHNNRDNHVYQCSNCKHQYAKPYSQEELNADRQRLHNVVYINPNLYK